MSKRKKTSSKKRKHKFLKAVGRGIYRFFELIYKVIDKIIITPISKLLFAIGSLLKTNNKPLDRLLNNKVFLVAFSLVLAMGAFFLVDNTADIIINSTADVITSVPVTALYNTNSYVVEGIPETVDVVLIGRKSDIYLTKQYPTTSVTVDLSKLKPRNRPYEISLKYNGAISSVEYKADPTTVSVMIYEKLSEERTFIKEVLNIDSLNAKYSISDVSFSSDKVFIKGKEDSLKEVAIIKALIDADELSKASEGKSNLKNIPLAAYNKNGERVNVEIVPAVVDATITISSPKEQVPIKIIPEGEVIFGKAIESMTANISTITIYGETDIIKNIESIPVKINVADLAKNTEINVNLSMPSGVRAMSANTIKVKITLTDITEKKITGVPISIIKIADGYTAQAASKEDSTVTVIVKGTASNLKNITKDNVKAEVDLSGITKESDGELVNVSITGDDLRLTYEAQKKQIKVIIKKE